MMHHTRVLAAAAAWAALSGPAWPSMGFPGLTKLGAGSCIGNRAVLQYNYQSVPPPEGVATVYAHNAYIHPIWNLAGQVVTDDFAADHYHHRGLWLAWSKTTIGNRPANFWEFQEGSGRICFDRIAKQTAGPQRAMLVADHLWQVRHGAGWITVLREQWTVVAQRAAGCQSGLLAVRSDQRADLCD